jgi:hypothetical protein
MRTLGVAFLLVAPGRSIRWEGIAPTGVAANKPLLLGPEPTTKPVLGVYGRDSASESTCGFFDGSSGRFITVLDSTQC